MGEAAVPVHDATVGRRARRRALLVLGGALVVSIIGGLVVWRGPDAVGFAVMGAGIGILLTGCLLVFPTAFLEAEAGTPHERLTNANEFRTVLIEALVGFAILAGAVVTWQQLQSNADLIKLTQDQQVTERYRESVSQLGENDVVVRLGGIYSLQRLAADSRLDQGGIYRVLADFIRMRSPWPPRAPTDNMHPTRTINPMEIDSLRKRSPDIQQALSVISDPKRSVPFKPLLVDVDLRGALLGSANLDGADLRNAHLDFADARVNPAARRLTLRKADLREATLTHARLKRADLTEAQLQGADLRNAVLDGAVLCRAKLQGVPGDKRLGDAKVDGASFVGAVYDDETTFPDGFHPEGKGMLRQACPAG
jgi:Pentapeptide repeats (8 copies)